MAPTRSIDLLYWLLQLTSHWDISCNSRRSKDYLALRNRFRICNKSRGICICSKKKTEEKTKHTMRQHWRWLRHTGGLAIRAFRQCPVGQYGWVQNLMVLWAGW